MRTPTVTTLHHCPYCKAQQAARGHALARANQRTPGVYLASMAAAARQATAAAVAAHAAGVQPCTGCHSRKAQAAARAAVRRTLGYAAAVAAHPYA